MRPVGRIAIVGASAAGVSAALELRRSGFSGTVTVFDADRRMPYERPALSKSLGRDGREPLVPIAPAEVYRDNAIDLVPGTAVTDLDPDGGWLVAAGEKVGFDRVLLACGARARTLPPERAGNVHTLRSADDAEAIAAGLTQGARLVVIGGGFLGLEVASSASATGARVTVVEASAGLCAGSVGTRAGARLATLHRDRGVDVRLSAPVARLAGSGTVDGVVLASGERLAADLVVIGIGVTPNTELATGLAVDGGIIVDQAAATRHPRVFAAGDVTTQPPHRHHPGGRIEQWDNARAQGAVAARSMLGLPAAHLTVPYFWSDQHGYTLQMYGRPVPADELVWCPSPYDHGFRAFWLRRGRLVAAAALARRPILAGARTLIELKAPIDPAQVTGEGVDLRALARATRRGAAQRTT